MPVAQETTEAVKARYEGDCRSLTLRYRLSSRGPFRALRGVCGLLIPGLYFELFVSPESLLAGNVTSVAIAHASSLKCSVADVTRLTLIADSFRN